MTVELKIPGLGESITEVTIGEWLVASGEWVAEDQPVVVIETDKANAELPAPTDGVLSEIVLAEGETAQVGDVVARITPGPAPTALAGGAAVATPPPVGDGAPKVMPAARRALAEAGLTADQVQPSGPGGRVLKEDVARAVGAGRPAAAPRAAAAAPRAAAPRAAAAPRPAPPASRAPSGERAETVAPMSKIRRLISERLVQAQQTAALLTTFNEVDMSAVMALRARYKEPFSARHGVKLGFMSFFVKAAIEGLRAFPAINAEIRGTDIVTRHYHDIGIAVGGGKGLVVPILRDADRLSFAEIEQSIGDLARRAAAGTIRLDELQGGTFSISNGGIYGSMLSTPIVNPPQSGILGMHNILERPVARDGQVVIRPMMYLALTYDHRIVDGREAVGCLVRIKETIEDPARLLFEV